MMAASRRTSCSISWRFFVGSRIQLSQTCSPARSAVFGGGLGCRNLAENVAVCISTATCAARFQVLQLLLRRKFLPHGVGHPLGDSRRVGQPERFELWAEVLGQLHVYRAHFPSASRRNASAGVIASMPNRAAAAARSRTLCVTIQSLPDARAASRTNSSSGSGTEGRVRKWTTNCLPTRHR